MFRNTRKREEKRTFPQPENMLQGSPLRSSYKEGCRKKCSEKVAEEERRKIYQKCRDTTEAQNQALCGLILEVQKTRKLLQKDERKLKKICKALFSSGSRPKREVCQTMLLSTFGITFKKA